MKIIRSFLFAMTALIALLYISGQNSAWARGFTLSEATHRRLGKIHRLVEKDHYRQALKELGVLQSKVKRGDHEKALVLQTYGYIYADQHDWSKAIESFEKCLAVAAMPEPAEQAIRFNLAQLYGAEKKYKRAIQTFEVWMNKEKNVSASQHALGGRLYAEARLYQRAAHHFRTALANTTTPNEEWYRGLLAVYYHSERYKQAANLLEKMLGLFPGNKRYWHQLSNIYYLLNNSKKSVALMEVMRLKGFLTEQDELLRLASLYLNTNLPYKAATLLETALKDRKIDENRQNLQLLSDYYFRANEVEKAEQILQVTAGRWRDSELYLKIAKLQLNQEKWSQAALSIKSALDIGELEKPGQAYLLRGMAYYEQDDHQKALAAFNLARQEKSSKKQAIEWIDFISSSPLRLTPLSE